MTALQYADTVMTGHAGYAPTAQLTAALQSGRAARAWRLGSRVVSIQLTKSEGAGIWKSRERMPMSDPRAMLDTLESVGVNHPASYADCYHQLAPKSKPLAWTLNGMFAWWPGGPWEEAKLPGEHRGRWYRYDLRSAYRWAATMGLPDPASYRAVTRGTVDGPGLWLVKMTGKTTHLPPIYRTSYPVVLSTEEIEAYGVTPQVMRGIAWSKEMPRDYVERTLSRLPCAKQSGRAYWGRWIARDKLTCWTPNKEWAMNNIHAHFIWGWLVIGRVRLRLWQAGRAAAHVYVDEVVVPHTLPTGDNVGDWHLKEEYPKGVAVYRTGWYGARGGATTMQTGVQH